jgi:hypothetical protein
VQQQWHQGELTLFVVANVLADAVVEAEDGGGSSGGGGIWQVGDGKQLVALGVGTLPLNVLHHAGGGSYRCTG